MITQLFKAGDLVREKTNPTLQLTVKEYEVNYVAYVVKTVMGGDGFDPSPRETTNVICTYFDEKTNTIKTIIKDQSLLENWD